MEILALRVRVTEDDVVQLLKRLPEQELPVRDLKVQFTPEGVAVTATYPTTLLSVPFHMLWKLDVVGGKVRATLSSLDFYGVPAGPLRGMILSFIHEEVAKLPGLTREGDTILVDTSVLASSLGVPVTIPPREVRHEAGGLVFIAGE
jgi:hypothetical protein